MVPTSCGRLEEPTNCSGCGKSWTMKLLHNRCLFLNRQLIKMQVLPAATLRCRRLISVTISDGYHNATAAVVAPRPEPDAFMRLLDEPDPPHKRLPSARFITSLRCSSDRVYLWFCVLSHLDKSF